MQQQGDQAAAWAPQPTERITSQGELAAPSTCIRIQLPKEGRNVVTHFLRPEGSSNCVGRDLECSEHLLGPHVKNRSRRRRLLESRTNRVGELVTKSGRHLFLRNPCNFGNGTRINQVALNITPPPFSSIEAGGSSVPLLFKKIPYRCDGLVITIPQTVGNQTTHLFRQRLEDVRPLLVRGCRLPGNPVLMPLNSQDLRKFLQDGNIGGSFNEEDPLSFAYTVQTGCIV